MPSRGAHICGCGRKVAAGARCDCQVKRDRDRKSRHDARRPSARARGYNSDWDKARADFLQSYPRCAYEGCRSLATIVDHVIPHRGDPALFWDSRNWQPLCGYHHSVSKQAAERRGASHAD